MRSGIGTDFEQNLTGAGSFPTHEGPMEVYVTRANSRLKSHGMYLYSKLSACDEKKLISATLQLIILDTIDNPGCITLQMGCIPVDYWRVLVEGEILVMTSKTVTCYPFFDEGPGIHVEVVFISKFTQNEAGTLPLVGNGGSC